MSYYHDNKNKFSHKFNICLDYKNRQELVSWLKENCGLYNKDYIYWALKARVIGQHDRFDIYFKSKENAMAFKLVWM